MLICWRLQLLWGHCLAGGYRSATGHLSARGHPSPGCHSSAWGHCIKNSFFTGGLSQMRSDRGHWSAWGHCSSLMGTLEAVASLELEAMSRWKSLHRLGLIRPQITSSLEATSPLEATFPPEATSPLEATLRQRLCLWLSENMWWWGVHLFHKLE